MMSRYLLVSRSAEFESRLDSLLGARLTTIGGAHLAEGPQAVFARAPRRPGVALLGPMLNFEETKALSDGFVERFPDIGIVIIRDGRADLEDWVDGMAIHAVLPPDADDDTVERVLARLDERASQRDDDLSERSVVATQPPAPVPADMNAVPAILDEGERPRVIAVVAPKGGQGKTTIAVNLATGLAEIAPNSVVLVDADLQFGDVAHTLDMPPRRTIDELVGRDAVSIKTALMHYADDFFVVPAPRSPEDADLVSPAALGSLLDSLAGIFRYVVVDTTPGLSEHTLSVLDHSTDSVFVAGLAVASLRALHSELVTLENIELLPRSRKVVINFVDRFGGLTVKDAATIVGTDVDFTIPRSSAVLLAANRGRPVIHADARDDAARALRELVMAFDPSALPSRRRIHWRRP